MVSGLFIIAPCLNLLQILYLQWIYGPRSAGQVEDTLVSQFGIKCDGDKWKVTKYPMGIYYLSTEKDILFGLGGKYDGMKTEVTQMAW